MQKIRAISMIFVCFMFFLLIKTALSETVLAPDGQELTIYREGGSLQNTCNYQWWYGCSPTSVGMLMGYYDRHGFGNLTVGGEAESSSFPSTEGNWDYLCQYTIASPEHVSDFYVGGYGVSGDDKPLPHHSFNCLADFMGTSQDNLSTIFGGNSNGATTFLFYNNNAPLTEDNIFSYGPQYYNICGMYGIGEYLRYREYDAGILYNQRIYGYEGVAAGFTFAQYKAEIDAGRPVIVHVQEHSMLGYGYSGNNILVYDTWLPNGQNPGTMVWGGSYPYGTTFLPMIGVTVVELIPEPATIFMLSLGCLVFVVRKRG